MSDIARATRTGIEINHGNTQIRVTRETTRTGSVWAALFRPRERTRDGRTVLNGDMWSVEHRSYTGVRYESIRPATHAELIQFADLNINPHTAPAVLRGELSA